MDSIMTNNCQALKPYIPKTFWTKLLEKPTARPKLVKEYVFANALKSRL